MIHSEIKANFLKKKIYTLSALFAGSGHLTFDLSLVSHWINHQRSIPGRGSIFLFPSNFHSDSRNA